MDDLAVNDDTDVLAGDLVGDDGGVTFAEEIELEAVLFPGLTATDGDCASKERCSVGGTEYFDCRIGGTELHKKLGLEVVAVFVSDDDCHDVVEWWQDGFKFDWVAEDGFVILFDGETRMF